MCVLLEILLKKRNYVMSVFQYLLDGQQTSRNSEGFYTQMFYSKKSQFFHRARNYSNNPKKLTKKMEYFYEYKDDCSKL